MHLVGLLVLAFVPFCISRVFQGTDPPPVDGQEPPVDGVSDEGIKNYRVDESTNKLLNGQVYRVDDESLPQGTDPPPVDGQEPPVDGVSDEGIKNYRVDESTNKLLNGQVYRVDDESLPQGTDPPPVDGQEPPVDGVSDEGTKNYRVDDETNETIDPDDPMVNGIDDEKGPMKAEELWNLPYPKHT